LALAVVVTSCAAPPASPPPASSQPGAAAPPAAPKRINSVIRGDPRTLSEPVNAAAGGSTSAGVRELEQLVNAGLGYVDNHNELRPQLAEVMPTIENGLWRVLPDGRME